MPVPTRQRTSGLDVKKEECFGILEKVFPVGESGLREVAPDCFHCPDRTPCLRKALASRDGLRMREEILERAESRGLVGRLQRWSRKKSLQRRLRQQERQGK
jgi:hypothetical protein